MTDEEFKLLGLSDNEKAIKDDEEELELDGQRIGRFKYTDTEHLAKLITDDLQEQQEILKDAVTIYDVLRNAQAHHDVLTYTIEHCDPTLYDCTHPAEQFL